MFVYFKDFSPWSKIINWLQIASVVLHSNTNQKLTDSYFELFNDRYRAIKVMRKNIFCLVSYAYH